jgi:hypothetical protein
MRLSKKDRRQLEYILSDLKRGIAFVMKDDTALMRKHNLSSCDYFSSDYPDYANQKWSPIEKRAGNDFVIAISAMNRLESLLSQENESIS